MGSSGVRRGTHLRGRHAPARGASASLETGDDLEAHREWAFAQPGEWLAQTLEKLASPALKSSKPAKPKKTPLSSTTSGPAMLRLRSGLGMSRSTFAAKLGVGVSTLAKWERDTGKIPIPKPASTKLAKLGTSVK